MAMNILPQAKRKLLFKFMYLKFDLVFIFYSWLNVEGHFGGVIYDTIDVLSLIPTCPWTQLKMKGVLTKFYPAGTYSHWTSKFALTSKLPTMGFLISKSVFFLISPKLHRLCTWNFRSYVFDYRENHQSKIIVVWIFQWKNRTKHNRHNHMKSILRLI